jgi:trehalose/maltose hydrolase-like predicted phosphorylase
MRIRSTLGALLSASVLPALTLGAQEPTGASRDSAFLLTTDNPLRSPSPFVGNGRIGIVIPPLGIGPSLTLMAGLYEHGPDDVPRIVAVPAWNAIDVFDGEDRLAATPLASSIGGYRQIVDMRTGVAHTSYTWKPGVRETRVAIATFASRADSQLTAVQLTLTPRTTRRIRVRFALAGHPPPRRLPLATLTQAPPDWKPNDIWYPGHMEIRSRSAASRGDGASLRLASAPTGRAGPVLSQWGFTRWPGSLRNLDVQTRAEGDSAVVEIAFDAVAGRTHRFLHIARFVASDSSEADDHRGDAAEAAADRGFDALYTDNAHAWGVRWRTDIRVDGDPSLQRVIRSMLFYLLCSADRGTSLGIPPMGLSSAGYYGHIFWDSDTWMFPPLLVTHPDIARSLVAFRARTLQAARANARANGFRGAMYPWEADERGRETTPRFAIQNARSEIHINGDVALAQWQYFLATGDSAWLAREGYPVIRETAEFWLSRVRYDSADGRHHIPDVVSVSEGLIGVTDDAYTNAVARKNLEIASAASRRLGRPADPRWSRVASSLHLPYDSASQFFRTYEGAPDSTLGWVTPLLAYPLGVPMSPRAKRAQLEQAFARLLEEGPGAMMGSTILAVGAAELHDREMVDTLLPHSYARHVKGPFLMLSETPTNDAVNFVTGAGGFLQQVIFGWTGLRFGNAGLEPMYPPLLPSGVARLLLCNVSIRGERHDVIVDARGRRIVPAQCRAAA